MGIALDREVGVDEREVSNRESPVVSPIEVAAIVVDDTLDNGREARDPSANNSRDPE